MQGVWFREIARQKAESLFITGWVKNLPDGSVEVLACGVSDALEEFLEWLHQGPSTAKVMHVKSRSLPWEDHNCFEIKR